MCVKHVPDMQSDRRFEQGRIVRGEDDALNELDENAVEAAVQLVEEYGGESIALTMGPEDADDAVMRALQMGVNRGILVTDEALAGADVGVTARVLAAAVRKIHRETPIDLVITGMASLDSMTSMLPAALATHLSFPFLGPARRLETNTENATVDITREIDGHVDTLRAAMPAVVSVTDQMNEPRYPAFAAMKAARSKPLDEWTYEDLLSELGTEYSEEDAHLSAVISVVEAEEITRDGNATIVTDSGDAGIKLAQYLMEVVK